MKLREQTPAEELANVITHGFGLVLSVIGMAALVLISIWRGTAWHILSCSIFGTTLVVMYLASTLYHGVQSPRLKAIFRTFDHCCIFLLIAGTYTPFTLVVLRSSVGLALCGIIWGLAVAGILFRTLSRKYLQAVLTTAYLLMGWLAIVAIRPLLAAAPLAAIFWIFAGGAFYTIGVVFFCLEKIRYHHTIWHLFVLGGSLCHFLAVLFYVLPTKS